MRQILSCAAVLPLLVAPQLAAAQPSELELSGRLHVDASWHHGDSPLAKALDGTEVRRARLGLSGRLDGDFRFSSELELADPDAPIRDFWLRYDGWDDIGLTVGHQKQPYSLSLEMSSNDIPFVERSIDNSLITPFVDRAVGVRVDVSRGRWFTAAGLYGESTDRGPEGWGTSARFVFAPLVEDKRVIHLGIRAAYREPDAAADLVRIRTETTSFSSLHVADTGEIPGIERATLIGPEAALVAGPFSLTGEYTLAKLAGALGDLDFYGWHLGAAWTLGGESRAAGYALSSGELKGIEPARSFSLKGGGTWEIAARYASLDLNDGPLVGGEEKRFTLSANWYANPHVRMMVDWTHVVDTDGSSAVRAAADGLDAVTLRAQYAF